MPDTATSPWKSAGPAGLSIIDADRNAPARRLYAAFGFREAAKEPIVNEGWQCDSDAWVLLVKTAES